jgi:Cu(I)/Ag(I) efflux system periplasmic protein CusF
MKRIAAAFFVIALAQPLATLANDAHHKSAQTAQADLSDGEVRKVDKDAQKITIRHGPLKNLDMPPMTMVFQVKDPALLEQVKPGDKIRFSAEKSGGAYIVTTMRPEK